MTMRPSLVVCLGGTGSWTGAELKARLIADQRWVELGQNPEAGSTPEYDQYPFPVQLVALDVDKINRPIVSGVKLDRLTEDVGLDAPIGEILQHLRSLNEDQPSAYPSIEKWLPRSEAKQMEVNDAMTFMTSGAGQIRQFGRMAFFLDVLNKRQIVGRLGGAIGSLTGATDPEGELGIYVVSSVGGGAGAGLLIDTLLYLKDARTRLAGKVGFRTVVFVVLPGAFKNVLDMDKFSLSQANGYGALRELDRLINASDTVRVEWEPGREVRLEGAAADHVYLIDGSRDLDAGRNYEGWAKPEQAFPPALADAIYAHLMPSSGKVLVRDYPNLSEPLISGQPNRYSTFGTYLVQYDWERLLRSLTCQATYEVLRSRLQPSTANVKELASQFLTAQAPDTFTNNGQYQALPFLLTEVMTSPEVSLGGLDPNTRWLEPATSALPFPETPTVRDFFPDLKRITTRYDNQQVVDDTNVELARFWGEEFGKFKDGEPQFHPVANSNQEACEQQFALGLHLAAAAVMNLNHGIGGLPAALGFVDEIDRVLGTYSEYLGKIELPGLAPYEEAVTTALEEMQDNIRIDDFKEQKDYLKASQELLQEQRRDQSKRRAQILIGRFRHITGTVKSDLTGWQQNVEHLAAEAEAARLTVNNERLAANEVPLRRMVPLPDSAVERNLYQACAGLPDKEFVLPASLIKAMASREWRIHVKRDNTMAIVWTRQVPTELAPPADADPETIELHHMTDQLGYVFLPLRDRHVFDILEQEGTDVSTLASEIRTGAARLAAFDQTRQLQHTINNVAVQDWNYVFADWRRDGPGSDLAIKLRSLLDDAAPAGTSKPTEDLAALPRQGSLPTSDKILAFSARHLILLDAFRGVGILAKSYERRREATPSPHVLPEERGAAELEARSETLAHDGFLSNPLTPIEANQVPLCGDLEFLQRVAVVVANGKLTYEVEDAIAKKGAWKLYNNGTPVEVGREHDLGELLERIAIGTDHASRQAKEAIKQVQLSLSKEEDAKAKTVDYAMGNVATPDVNPATEQVLRVAAVLDAH